MWLCGISPVRKVTLLSLVRHSTFVFFGHGVIAQACLATSKARFERLVVSREVVRRSKQREVCAVVLAGPSQKRGGAMRL